jgi:hypothetical protein
VTSPGGFKRSLLQLVIAMLRVENSFIFTQIIQTHGHGEIGFIYIYSNSALRECELIRFQEEMS